MAVCFTKRTWQFMLLVILLVLITQLLVYQPKHKETEMISVRTLELQELLKCHNRRLKLHKLQHGNYWVIKNLIVGHKSRNMNCANSITYTTNGDYTFFDNLEMVTERWLAPVSFAIYTPGYDLKSTLDAIQYVRNCLPVSQLISDFVSFHVYFPNNHMPKYVPYDEDEALKWPIRCEADNGTLLPPPYLQPRSSMYKVKANLTYPINVGRNIARQAVNTHFIFACDIELYPSLDFVDQFLNMVHRENSVLGLKSDKAPRVYPLPVFEISHGEFLPNNKIELYALIRNKRARIFHVRTCLDCHKVPEVRNWFNQASADMDRLKLLGKTLRQGKFQSWEPFYISDNTEPFFDERLSWEGKSNKRIQGYAMCLLGYEYHVLYPAFLVHKVGSYYWSQNAEREKFSTEVTKLIKFKIEPEYQIIYGKNKNCST